MMNNNQTKKLKHIASYSQYSMWNACPYRWRRLYGDKLGKKLNKPSIHLIFGIAMHTALQAYITAFFTKSIAVADSMDLMSILSTTMREEYDKQRQSLRKLLHNDIVADWGDDFDQCVADMGGQEEYDKKLDHHSAEQLEKYVPQNDMIEFYYDGEQIIKYFVKNRRKYLNKKTDELVGIELPIIFEVVPGLEFRAYLDVVIKNKITGKYRILDLKTSTKGWSKFQKNDVSKTQQLVIYKHYFAEKYNISPDMVDVAFIILKRKLYENSNYPQKRILSFSPPSGKPTRNKTIRQFDMFTKSCFTADGDYNLDGIFPKIVSDSNCRFCPLANDDQLCDKIN